MGGYFFGEEVNISLYWAEIPRLRRVLLSFASPKESKQRKGDPGSVPAAPVPCATRCWRGLRNSGCALRQSSPLIRQPLRCSAPPKGPGKTAGAEAKVEFGFWPFFDVDPDRLVLTLALVL